MNAATVLAERKPQTQTTRAGTRESDRASHGATSTLSTSDALSMRVELNDPTKLNPESNATLSVTPTHVVRMSCEELRFDHCDSLESSQRIWVQMRLGCSGAGQRVNNNKVVVACAEVISSDSKKDHSGNKCYDTTIRFVDCDKQLKSMVQSHIEDVIAKLGKNCREYTYVPGGLSHTAA